MCGPSEMCEPNQHEWLVVQILQATLSDDNIYITACEKCKDWKPLHKAEVEACNARFSFALTKRETMQ